MSGVRDLRGHWCLGTFFCLSSFLYTHVRYLLVLDTFVRYQTFLSVPSLSVCDKLGLTGHPSLGHSLSGETLGLRNLFLFLYTHVRDILVLDMLSRTTLSRALTGVSPVSHRIRWFQRHFCPERLGLRLAWLFHSSQISLCLPVSLLCLRALRQ